jgi:hypothetical protein
MNYHRYADIQAIKTAVTEQLCSIPESDILELLQPSEMLAMVYRCRGRLFRRGKTQ